MRMPRLISVLAVLFGAPLVAHAQWGLASPLLTNIAYSISYTGTAGGSGSVTIFAKAPGSSTWTGPYGGGGGPPGSQVTASGAISFSVTGSWTIKAVDGGSSSSPTLSQITRQVDAGTVPTTFGFGSLTHTYDGTTKWAVVFPNPANATYGATGLPGGPGAGSYPFTVFGTGGFSGTVVEMEQRGRDHPSPSSAQAASPGPARPRWSSTRPTRLR